MLNSHGLRKAQKRPLSALGRTALHTLPRMNETTTRNSCETVRLVGRK